MATRRKKPRPAKPKKSAKPGGPKPRRPARISARLAAAQKELRAAGERAAKVIEGQMSSHTYRKDGVFTQKITVPIVESVESTLAELSDALDDFRAFAEEGKEEGNPPVYFRVAVQYEDPRILRDSESPGRPSTQSAGTRWKKNNPDEPMTALTEFVVPQYESFHLTNEVATTVDKLRTMRGASFSVEEGVERRRLFETRSRAADAAEWAEKRAVEELQMWRKRKASTAAAKEIEKLQDLITQDESYKRKSVVLDVFYSEKGERPRDRK